MLCQSDGCTIGRRDDRLDALTSGQMAGVGGTIRPETVGRSNCRMQRVVGLSVVGRSSVHITTLTCKSFELQKFDLQTF